MAVVTGAGSGIGRALSVQLAAQGARLALIDADAAALAAVASRCRGAGARARADAVDVTDRAALLGSAATASAEFGRVDVVFCAAGIIHTGSLLASDWADIDRVIDVNLTGTVNTVKSFLPHVIASGGGRVILFSSGFGLVAAPRYSAYSASKFAVRGLGEALRQEMALDRHPVSVTCVYPGAVRTPIVSRGSFAADVDPAEVTAAFGRLARLEPARAASAILRQAAKGKGQVLAGRDARAAAVLARAAGGSYPRLISWALRMRRGARWRSLGPRDDRRRPQG